MKWQIEANIKVLRSLADASRILDNLALDDNFISAGLVELYSGAARAEFLARQAHNAIKEVQRIIPQTFHPVLTLVKATRLAALQYTTKMETFSWYNLKLNYAVESGTNQTTLIFALIAPAIFTSVCLRALSLQHPFLTDDITRHSLAPIFSLSQLMDRFNSHQVCGSGLQ